MKDIIKSFSSPYWWITVVAVGYIINIASSYTKPGLDKLMSRVSANKKRILDVKNLKIQEEIVRLLNEPTKVTDLRLDLIRGHLTIIEGLLLTVFLFVLAGFQDRLPNWYFFPFNPYQTRAVILPFLLVSATAISILSTIAIRKNGEKRDLLYAYVEQEKKVLSERKLT